MLGLRGKSGQRVFREGGRGAWLRYRGMSVFISWAEGGGRINGTTGWSEVVERVK